jgi:hypothetical protein
MIATKAKRALRLVQLAWLWLRNPQAPPDYIFRHEVKMHGGLRRYLAYEERCAREERQHQAG